MKTKVDYEKILIEHAKMENIFHFCKYKKYIFYTI